MSKPIFTRVFWLDTIERVVATMVQFLVVLGGADGTGFLEVEDWRKVAVLVAAGGLAALVKAVWAATRAQSDTASFTVENKGELK